MDQKHNNYSTFTKLLIILLLGAFLEDIIVIDLGLFYLRTYKISLLISLIVIFKKFNFEKLPFPKTSNFIFFVIIFLILQTISVFYSVNLPLSQKVNYAYFNLASIFLLLYIPRFLQENPYWISPKLTKLLFIFFFTLIIFVVGQRFDIPFFSDFSLSASEKMWGVFYERLFLAEFLIIITVILVLNGNIKGLSKYITIAIVTTIILLSDSTTGKIGLLSFIFLFNLKLKNIIPIGILVISLLFVIWPFVTKNVLKKYEIKNMELRNERYFGENMNETNWRILSSIVIIDDFISNPTFIGHGFRDNAFLLKPYYWNQDSDAFASSHTFIAVLRDQGILGGILIIIIIFSMIKKLFKLLIFNFKKPDKYLKISLVFGYLFLLRLLFYYQSTFHWHFIIAIILISYYSKVKFPPKILNKAI